MVDDKGWENYIWKQRKQKFKEKEIGKKTKHVVGKLSTEEKDLATLGPNTTFTTPKDCG